jgi:hypothetical protein
MKILADMAAKGGKKAMKSKLVYWMREGRERLKSLNLTVCCEGDSDVLGSLGLAELRRQRMLRLIEEAREQGARLTYRDLSLILLTSKATLKRDMRTTGR